MIAAVQTQLSEDGAELMTGQIRIAIPSAGKKIENYVNAVQYLGEYADTVSYDVEVNEFDGLIMPGGYDVYPKWYGEEIAGSLKMDRELDSLQFAVLDRFMKAGKPVLGICRGHQILNIYFGGTLVQDIGYGGKMLHTPSVWGIDKVHPTRASTGSWIAKIYGKTDIRTNSAHHQAVKKLGAGMVPCQWGEDRIIEACYHKELPVISVQWHPERMCFEKERKDTDCGQPVFEYFLDMCQKYRNV